MSIKINRLQEMNRLVLKRTDQRVFSIKKVIYKKKTFKFAAELKPNF